MEQAGRWDGVEHASALDGARMRVSALIDAELDDAGFDAAIDELLASDELARFWSDAHCAGDWLRSDEVTGVGHPAVFMSRFSTLLAHEPAIVAPAATRRTRDDANARRFWWRTGLPGASAAAALIAVAWVAGPFDRSASQAVGPSTIRPVSNEARGDGSGSIVVKTVSAPAQDVAEARKVSRDASGEDWSVLVEAHRDVTPFGYRGPMARQTTFAVSEPVTAASR